MKIKQTMLYFLFFILVFGTLYFLINEIIKLSYLVDIIKLIIKNYLNVR